MPAIDREVRLPPGLLGMIDDPGRTVAIAHAHQPTWFFVYLISAAADGEGYASGDAWRPTPEPAFAHEVDPSRHEYVAAGGGGGGALHVCVDGYMWYPLGQLQAADPVPGEVGESTKKMVRPRDCSQPRKPTH